METDECKTCGKLFNPGSGWNHSLFCDNCGDPGEGYETFDDMLARKIDYKEYLENRRKY